MADLQQIVGAILRDLAKARFGSDLYSRSIARYYENDYLLRKFPVPRSEIEEVEIDLKFSISDILDSDVNAESREANVAFMLERTVERLVATFLDVGRQLMEKPEHGQIARKLADDLSKGFNSATIRIELRQGVLRYFIESYTYLISNDGRFNHELALTELKRPFRWSLYNYRKQRVDDEGEPEHRALIDALDGLYTLVAKDEAFIEVVKSLEGSIANIWQKSHDARLEVEVDGHKLAEMSDAAISSLRIKAVVRNHVWTEVKVGDRETQRSLTSE